MGAQVKREISIMKLVRHPYVVQLREVLASSSKIFLVCELITGGELFDKIVEKQVTDTGAMPRMFRSSLKCRCKYVNS